MNCKEITELLDFLLSKKKDFDVASQKEKPDIETMYRIKEEIENHVLIDQIFLAELDKNVDEIVLELKDRFQIAGDAEIGDGREIMREIFVVLKEKLLAKIPVINLTSKRYQSFLQSFPESRAYTEIATAAEILNQSDDIINEVRLCIRQAVNTSFLNHCCIRSKIVVDEIPAELLNYFCVGLNNPKAEIEIAKVGDFCCGVMESGHVRVGEAGVSAGLVLIGGKLEIGQSGSQCGMSMTGGELIVDETEGSFCCSMDSGRAKAKVVGDSACNSMHGGSVMIGQAGDGCARLMDGGFVYFEKVNQVAEIKGGNIVVEDSNYLHPIDIEYMERIWHREKIWIQAGSYVSRYVDLSSKSLVDKSRVVPHQDLLDGANNSESPFEIYEGHELNGFNPTEGLQKGFVVLHQSLPEYGKNMTGGAVIIEAKGVSIEQVRTKISPEKKGGFILMRLPNPEIAGETHLVDVEG
ncbi:MAG: hypothetical protein NTW50_01320 [Candidatus Berkelbacteria bacterium]|nr:hypothetical protein [Candidatus Berkelbacteria bacterium]